MSAKAENKKLTKDHYSKFHIGNSKGKRQQNSRISDDMNIYQFYFLTPKQPVFKPSVREGATMVNVSGKAVMYGGISNKVFNQILVLERSS